MQFETQKCEISKCATSHPSYTHTYFERAHQERNHLQLPPTEEDSTHDSKRVIRTSQPAKSKPASWAAEPVAQRSARRSSATDPAHIRSHKSQPPREEARSIVTMKPIPPCLLAPLEWRNTARCGLLASNRGKQAQLTQPAYPDDLNAMVQRLAADYAPAASWTEFVENFRGHQGDFHPQVKHIPHGAATLLDNLRRNGASVQLSTPNWTMAQKEAELERGAHQSANAHITFLRGEFADMIHKKQWILPPAALAMTQEELRISTLGVPPQRDRRPRSIIDYTFYHINEDTVVRAPPEAMQFGKALWRILAGIVQANTGLGPVYLSKVDIADGFYHIWVKAADIPKLGVLLPAEQGQERLIGFPVVLPMGWKESPPVFTSATETVTDLANGQIQQGTK
jgi:hypothetical protein